MHFLEGVDWIKIFKKVFLEAKIIGTKFGDERMFVLSRNKTFLQV